jgi:hypothetical protein
MSMIWDGVSWGGGEYRSTGCAFYCSTRYEDIIPKQVEGGLMIHNCFWFEAGWNTGLLQLLNDLSIAVLNYFHSQASHKPS